MNTIKVYDLLNQSNIKIIDIRDNYNYNQEHVLGAINIPELLLKQMPTHYLSLTKTYCLYCSFGKKSKDLSNYLNSLGYKTISLEGGYREYYNYIHKEL